jgi:hypothetical protein
MFTRPACLQGRQRNGAGEDWSAFPIRQLFILGKFGTFARITNSNSNYATVRRAQRVRKDNSGMEMKLTTV